MTHLLDYQPPNLYTNYQEAAEKTPTVPIIFDKSLPAFSALGLETTYGESRQEVLKRVYQLTTLGIRKGDKIVIYKSPKSDTYLLAVAASYLAAVPVTVSYHLPFETIEVFVDRLEDPYILLGDMAAEEVQAVRNGSANRKLSVASSLETDAMEVPQDGLTRDEVAYMTHTSGTAGIPKLICHSNHSMGWRTKWQKTISTKTAEKKLVGFHISPVYSRFSIGVSSLMAMGFPMMPSADSSSEKVAEMFSTYQPIAVEIHPNNFIQWARLTEGKPGAFASVHYYHSAFDAINNATMVVFLKASAANEPIFLQVYGQSECGLMILRAHTLESLRDSDARDMGVGLEDLTQARVTDEKGQVLPAMTDDHIQFLSRGRALAYYKEDAHFAGNVYGEWWDSGDYGVLDERGHLFLEDRQVGLIENIDSDLAVEDHLLDALDFLGEVIIVRGKENESQPILAVIPGEEMDWDAWWTQVADLPHLNEPITVVFDEIPHAATMKVQRLQLEKWLKEQ